MGLLRLALDSNVADETPLVGVTGGAPCEPCGLSGARTVPLVRNRRSSTCVDASTANVVSNVEEVVVVGARRLLLCSTYSSSVMWPPSSTSFRLMRKRGLAAIPDMMWR